MNLDFIQPVSYDVFKKNHQQNAKYPGIYIWGFMNNGDFVPYYVGKSQGDIYKRIINEHFLRVMKANTYIIFKDTIYQNLANYLKHLPRNAKPSDNLFKNTKLSGALIYMNDLNYLNTVYKSRVNSNSQGQLKKGLTSQDLDKILISSGTSIQIQSTIDAVFFPKSNSSLYITYATVKNQYWKGLIELAETCVKFCLKTNTISESLKIENIPLPFILISSRNNNLGKHFHHISSASPSLDLNQSIYYGYTNNLV